MNKKKNLKGYILTWDALLALFIIIITFTSLLTLGYLSFDLSQSYFEKLHFIAEDSLDILNKNSVLEEIVSNWAQDRKEIATEIANYHLNKLVPVEKPKVGYRLEINNENITERFSEIEGRAKEKTRAIRFLSGYKFNETGKNVFVARAWLFYNDTEINKTYTLENVPYGNSFKIALGANWTIQHLGGISVFCIPEDCSGDDTHSYVDGNCPYPQNTKDALDDATFRLLRKIDTDLDCKIENIDLNDNKTFRVSSVPTKQIGNLTEVKLILWM